MTAPNRTSPRERFFKLVIIVVVSLPLGELAMWLWMIELVHFACFSPEAVRA